MTSFSSLMSSIGAKPQAPNGTTPPNTQLAQPARTPHPAAGDRFKLTPSNAVAGMKRRSEEPDTAQRAKAIKTETNGAPNRPIAASANRFQLTSHKPKTSANPQRPATASASSTNPQRTLPKQSPSPGANNSLTAAPANGAPPAKPKGFLSILEKAKEASKAALASSAGGIKHKPAEKLTKKDRLRLMEERKAAKKAGGAKRPGAVTDGSRSSTPVGAKHGQKRPAEPLAYQGTMKKLAPAPLAYKGTMRKEIPGGPPQPKAKQRGMAQDKYGGYASWDDLSDVEDEGDEDVEEDYESDDMEGGFDDVALEEELALRAAQKEDREAMMEEEKLKAEKLVRKRKLQELSKKAAASKRY